MKFHTTLRALAAVMPLAAGPASALSVIGNLANFDTVNNTGHSAYGFEIELEDPQLWDDSRNASLNGSSKYVYDVFGLNRDFGLPGGPSAVVRFGAVSVSNYNDANGAHAGVRITYGLGVGSLPGVGAIATQAAPASGFSTPGESCWPGANANWQANPCDHFGVSTAGTPMTTRYSWLVQAAPDAPLTRQLVAIPAVAYELPAPVGQPGQPPLQPVVGRIEAVELNPEARNPNHWGSAVWVKTFTTVTKSKDIDLGNLLIGQGGDADLNAKLEVVDIAWTLLQDRPRLAAPGEALEGVEADEALENRLELDDTTKAFIRRYEFYDYVGGYDSKRKGRALCARDSTCIDDPEAFQLEEGQQVIGQFLGRQIAGFNADPNNLPPLQPVPEPQTWALMLAGLGGVGGVLRRRRA